MREEPCRNRRGSSYIYLALSLCGGAEGEEQEVSVRSARTDCKSIVVIRGVVIRAEVPVRNADPFSVNPGRSPGMGKGAACTAGWCR